MNENVDVFTTVEPSSNVAVFHSHAVWLAFGFSVVYTLVGSVGNMATIVALLRSRKLRRNSANLFVVNLAAADFIFCAFNLPLNASKWYNQEWVLGTTLCRLFPFLFYGNLAVSIMNLLMITINRYFAIVHNHLYQNVYRKWNVAAMMAFCWIFSFGLLTPQLLGKWGEFGYKNTTFSCSFKEKEGKNSQPYLFVIGVGVPLCIMVPCYLCIFYTVRKSRALVRKYSGTKNNRQPRSQQKRFRRDDRKLTKMMLVVFLSFLGCNLPAVVVNFALSHQQMATLHVIGFILTWTSCIINPVIYAFSNRNYRQAYKALVGCQRSRSKIPRWASRKSSTSTMTSSTPATETLQVKRIPLHSLSRSLSQKVSTADEQL